MAGFALGISAARASDTFEVDRSHSSVGFKVRHLVSNVTGRFGDFSGTVMLDLTDPSRSSVAFKIKAASIDTQEPKRDGHLKSPDFFEVEKFPEWTFASTKIVKAQGNAYDVTGSFAMHGVTREITIPVELLGTAKDPWGNERAGFSSSFSLNRKEYGIVWNKILDAGGTLLGDEVTVSINLEAIKAKPAAPPAGK
jgi:polyisoprenoid-binding protein YceI